MLIARRTTRRTWANFLLLMLLSGAFLSTLGPAAPTARSYTLLGAQWQNPSVSYVIDGSFSQWTGFAPTFSGAAGDWNNTGRFNYYNSVSSGNHIKADENIGTNLAGTRRTISGSYITQFNLIVNVYSGYLWYVGSGPVPKNMYDLRSVLRHELGHATGLCHSHTTSYLMYPNIGTGQSKQIDNDALYGIDYMYHYNQYEPGPEGGCY